MIGPPARYPAKFSVAGVTFAAILWPIALVIGLVTIILGAVFMSSDNVGDSISTIFVGVVCLFGSIFLVICLSMYGRATNNTRAMFCACTRSGKEALKEIEK